MKRPVNNADLRAALFCMGDETFITRFHRNVAAMKAMGFQVQCVSIKPRQSSQSKPVQGILVDGWSRRFRGRLFTPLRKCEVALRFFAAVLSCRAQILFAHDLPALVVGWLVRCIQGRRRTLLVYDAMELETHRTPALGRIIGFLPPNWQRLKTERFLVKRSDIVISADYARTEVMARLYERDDILTCRNVPQLADVEKGRLFHKKLGLSENAFVFLYQGTVGEGRGLDQAIRSLPKVPDEVVLVIMGMSTESWVTRLQALADNQGVAERVFILPAVSSGELLKWTASADVVHSLIENTCLSYYLAAPNKFYEAAMTGVPVIASAFPEMEGVLTRHPYGMLVDPTSIEQIVTALICLYEHGDLRVKFRKVALRAARSELNWETECQKLKKRVTEVVRRLPCMPASTD